MLLPKRVLKAHMMEELVLKVWGKFLHVFHHNKGQIKDRCCWALPEVKMAFDR